MAVLVSALTSVAPVAAARSLKRLGGGGAGVSGGTSAAQRRMPARRLRVQQLQRRALDAVGDDSTSAPLVAKPLDHRGEGAEIGQEPRGDDQVDVGQLAGGVVPRAVASKQKPALRATAVAAPSRTSIQAAPGGRCGTKGSAPGRAASQPGRRISAAVCASLCVAAWAAAAKAASMTGRRSISASATWATCVCPAPRRHAVSATGHHRQPCRRQNWRFRIDQRLFSSSRAGAK